MHDSTNQTPDRCAACHAAGQRLEVTRYKAIGDDDWQELWRCADISACHDRLFPELAALIGHARPHGASWIRPDGWAEIAPGDVQTVLGALSEAADFTTTGAAVAYRSLSIRLGDDR